ncbi:nitrate/nitrite response regulator protein NarP [Bacillota bacterium]
MRILIVDKQPLVRKGIIQVLSSLAGEKEYYEAETVEEAWKTQEENHADIVFTELHLTDGSGLDLINSIKLTESTGAKFILLANYISIFEFRRAKELKVDAYILKDSDADDLRYAFKLILKNEKYYPHRLVEKALGDKEDEGLRLLTDREMDVFVELSKGLTNSQIGSNLYIAEGTTKKHISNILTKLNMTSRMEVLVYANKISCK